MLRRLLLALALCGSAHAATPPRIELSVTPAWKGWSRPGRATELDIRLRTDAATRVTLDVTTGRREVRTEIDLQPGRDVRLQIPVTPASPGTVRATPTGGPAVQRDIAVAQSESPVLGVGLASDDRVRLDGFQAVALVAEDLPRQASAYASVDALVLDAPTLAELDARQLGALLTHAAGCGRIVLVDADARVRRLVAGAAGCGGQGLMNAVSAAGAADLLKASLATRLPAPASQGDVADLARPALGPWNRVVMGLALYFAAACLVLVFFAAGPAWWLTTALAAAAALALLHTAPPASQLVIWSEGDSGAQLARYQAWQRFAGLARDRIRVPLPEQLAPSVQPCDPAQAMRFEFDARTGRATSAEFETRLFRPVSLCYAGSFPMARAPALDTRPGGERELRNAGSVAWPRGVLLAAGRAHELPALGAGARVPLGPAQESLLLQPAVRTATARSRPDGAAALWELELGGVTGIPGDSKGWLAVSVPLP